ncbi:MAG: methionine--tRNA ligase subunit beta, partial [Victivallales bacterium]|nr:methionine--tRNA ligase subunit beta [Victivallales bacterium]
HTVYWPTMLKAIGLEMPKTIFAHGWWLIGESKMSKSAGNVVNPMEMADKYGVDAFRYFLISEMSPGQDSSFTEEVFATRYNSDLANDLGNFMSRAVKMVMKQRDGVVPSPGEETEMETELKNAALSAATEMRKAIAGMRLDKGVYAVMNAIRAGNRYFEKSAPWKLAKSGEKERLDTVLYSAIELLRVVSGLLQPIMPEKCREIRETLGLTASDASNAGLTIEELSVWGGMKQGTRITDCASLFPRIDLKKLADGGGSEKAENPVEKNAEKAGKKNAKRSDASTATDDGAAGLITIDEFFNAKLKTAKILEAEKLEGADKLLKLKIDVGEREPRQIVAGIALHYKPEDIVGKTIVVVSNLKPAKIRGVESNGMLLAAKTPDGKLTLVTTNEETATGLSVG